jgi:glyoxylase-like metal-dependent hydrolase (beta-lactamase superfamily II)
VHSKEIGENLYLIDLQTGGLKGLIASYVIRGKKSIIVETGPTSSVPNLISGLKELDIGMEDVAYVAISHIHIDHGGGAGSLIQFLPNAKVVVHPRGVAHLVSPEKLWIQSKEVLREVAGIYGAPEPVPENKIIAASDGMILNAGNDVEVKAVETLGHASHHLSYYSSTHKVVFPGDAAGIYLSDFDVVIPTSPPPFHLDVALASLAKLARNEPEILCYSHFGQASGAVKRLHDYSTQIQLWARIAQEGLANKCSLDEIRARILDQDEAMHRIASFIETNPILKRTTIGNSVQGIVDFVEKSRF